MRRLAMGVMGAVLIVSSVPAWAQSRPLVTEDPETVPAGFMLFEVGFDYARDVKFPASGLEGNLLRIGTFGFSIGVGSIAEIQIDGSIRDELTLTSIAAVNPLEEDLAAGDSTSTFGDLMVGAKVRFLSETGDRPAMAVRFATRLPNAGKETGLGPGTMDFYYGIGIAKTVQSVRVAGNFGFGMLADPLEAATTNHVATYGFSVARAVAQGVEIVGELNGRFNLSEEEDPVGAETRSIARVGARFTKGPIRLDGALLLGVTDKDPTWGISGGLTYVFRSFTVQ